MCAYPCPYLFVIGEYMCTCVHTCDSSSRSQENIRTHTYKHTDQHIPDAADLVCALCHTCTYVIQTREPHARTHVRTRTHTYTSNRRCSSRYAYSCLARARTQTQTHTHIPVWAKYIHGITKHWKTNAKRRHTQETNHVAQTLCLVCRHVWLEYVYIYIHIHTHTSDNSRWAYSVPYVA